jgi:hypothetical protein
MNKNIERLGNCPDCAVEPGQLHKDNCDVERCSVCGGQRLSCGCEGHNKQFARWTGLWPGEAEAKFLGLDLNEFAIKKLDRIFFVYPQKETVFSERLRKILKDYDECRNTLINLLDNVKQICETLTEEKQNN